MNDRIVLEIRPAYSREAKMRRQLARATYDSLCWRRIPQRIQQLREPPTRSSTGDGGG